MKSRIIVIFLGCSLSALAVFSDELTAERRLELDRLEYARLWELQIDPAKKYDPSKVNGACDNGNFEDGLQNAQWSGGNGSVDSAGNPNLDAFIGGLDPGSPAVPTVSNLSDSKAHQTLVIDGVTPQDPFLSSLVAPSGGSKQAVRIGNAAPGRGSEVLSKTFIVQPETRLIRFSYAVVLQDPGPDLNGVQSHSPTEKPSFWVRVTGSNGVEIPGAAKLDNGSPKVFANRDNLFFKKANGGAIVYREWSCAEIDLRSVPIGEKVTVQFITEDCTLGAHYGYAYIDNVCGLCDDATSGSIKFTPAASTNCGPGKLCFDYTLPQAGTETGSIQAKLEIFQNGALLTTLAGQNTGTTYCFDINPATIPGLSTSAGSFDWIATADFRIGATVLAPKTVNSIVDKIGPYKINCDTGCCPGPNLVKNGDFELGNVDFTSAYTNVAVPPVGPVLPGQYAVVSSPQASGAASTWIAQNPSSCSTTGKFLAVNGATGQSSGFKVVWSQAVPVVPQKQYRFCASLRNFAQCALDVKPKISIRFNGGSPPSTVISANPANGCDWRLESRNVSTSGALINIEIVLDESGGGDGNDLAIDNISLQEMLPASPAEVLVNIASSNVTTTTYNMTATPPAQPHNFVWDVCEVNTAGNCVAGTQVSNGWTTPGATQFPGYIGTSLPTGAGPGVFQVQKKYRVIYTVFGECTAPTSSTWYFGFSLNAGSVVFAESLRALDDATR